MYQDKELTINLKFVPTLNMLIINLFENRLYWSQDLHNRKNVFPNTKPAELVENWM